MARNFSEAQSFFDKVTQADPAWSSFAHYYKAYCAIEMRGDGYIRVAIKDLKVASEKLETNKAALLLTNTFVHSSRRCMCDI